jgi:conjugative transfer pilus assembly protein TraH
MRNFAKTMVWGTGPESTGTGGIVRKMMSKASTDQFLDAEKAFIQASRPGVYGVLRGISTEIQSANLVADQLIDIVATEMTNQAIDEMFNVVSKAVKSTGKPMDSAMEEAMHDRRNEILDARKSNQDSIAAINTLVQLQKTIRENLRTTMNNKVH